MHDWRTPNAHLARALNCSDTADLHHRDKHPHPVRNDQRVLISSTVIFHQVKDQCQPWRPSQQLVDQQSKTKSLIWCMIDDLHCAQEMKKCGSQHHIIRRKWRKFVKTILNDTCTKHLNWSTTLFWINVDETNSREKEMSKPKFVAPVGNVHSETEKGNSGLVNSCCVASLLLLLTWKWMDQNLGNELKTICLKVALMRAQWKLRQNWVHKAARQTELVQQHFVFIDMHNMTILLPHDLMSPLSVWWPISKFGNRKLFSLNWLGTFCLTLSGKWSRNGQSEVWLFACLFPSFEHWDKGKLKENQRNAERKGKVSN